AGYAKGADGVYTSPADGRVVIEVLSTGGGTGDTERSSTASDWRKAGFDAQERNLPQALSLDGLTRASFPGLSLTAQSATDTAMSAAFATAQIGRPENRWNGINRGGYSNPEYDRVVDAFNSVLDPNERIQQRAAMAKIISDDLPGLLLYYNLQPAPHVAALTGPTPTGSDATGYVTWNILDWDLL
ncbi:MAG: peptide transporter, partial [Chloroflexi bacterium]|nr:peptide transporter [Chloroflexota bacterium]